MTLRSIQILTYPVLIAAIASLISATIGGLMRAGWEIPILSWNLALNHAPLMISCFLGTLICLERARGTEEIWAYIAPWTAGAGAVLTIAGSRPEIAKLLVTTGSAVLILIFARLAISRASVSIVVMGIGAATWFAGNILWLLNASFHYIFPWWLAFLIITIAAERLQLSRIIYNTVNVKAWFITSVTLILIGTLYSGISTNTGTRIAASGMILLTLWLLRNDIAWKTIKREGLPRFMGLSLLAGYFWLGTGSALAFLTGGDPGIYYDAMIHSILLGFVFSMIFAHAPVIFPSVLGLSVRYMLTFYIHGVLLHSSLVLRIAGDLYGWHELSDTGTLLNAGAIFLFIISTVVSVITAGRTKKSAHADHN